MQNVALTVADVGEFGLIAMLTEALPVGVRGGDHVLLGIGDDAAVWRPDPGQDVVITTDSLVEGVHFRLDWTDWRSLGHKSLAVNISDIAAMGAEPKLAVVTLGLRGDDPVEGLQDIYRGMGELARRHGMVIAGGDIVRSPRDLAIHVTALGQTRDSNPLLRGGARPGDVIAVSGTLGASAAGLRLLGEPPESPLRNAAVAETLIEAHLRPEPRVELGQILAEHGATSAMDLSDGLLGDLPKILVASGVSAILHEADIPVAAAVHALFPDDYLDMAMRGGEDYELLFTAPPGAYVHIAAIAAIAGTAGMPVTAVGRIETATPDGPELWLEQESGLRRMLTPGAWDHFGTA